VLQLKSPYKDGTTHIVMEPLEFMERLAALVPRPRLHLIRFHGVLAPNAKLRRQIVPAPPQRAAETSSEGAHAQGAPARMSWARLLKRVFDTRPRPAALPSATSRRSSLSSTDASSGAGFNYLSVQRR
jgi:hypothetical protein